MQCKACDGRGSYTLTECPRAYVGHKIARAANRCVMANKGHLPDAGGTLDQDAWFMSVYASLESEVVKIDAEDRNR